ncbi:MAG: LysR family transcriptional regulator [Chloroflexi bacterium]|nr:LysR family transcriptional regulator [Chloroflexota bacterium]
MPAGPIADALQNIHQLRAFTAVVESGSFTKAAARLRVTQPAVSMQVQRLQVALKTPLFRKEGHQLEATGFGLALYRQACDVLAAVDAMCVDIESITTEQMNHVSVGSTPAYATFVLPALLARFQKAHPTVRLTLVQGSSADLMEQVHRGQLDVALVRSTSAFKDDGAIPVGTDEILIIQSTLHPFTPAPSLTMAEAAQLPFVRRVAGPGQITALTNHLLPGLDLGTDNVVMTVTSWEGVKQAVRDGVGMAMAFRPVVRHELEKGEFRTVRIQGYQRIFQVGLIVSADCLNGRRTPALQDLTTLFQHELLSALQPLSDDSSDSAGELTQLGAGALR